MPVQIALLRGINVGGKNMIKMAELKTLFESIGCHDVQTYINSGNVVFESGETEAGLLDRIAQAIEAEFGLSIHIMVRTSDELKSALAASPYQGDADESGKNPSVGFFREAPSRETIARLEAVKGVDEFQVIGRELHLLFRTSVADSKLASQLTKLKEPVTVRNWNTVNKLAAIAHATQARIGG